MRAPVVSRYDTIAVRNMADARFTLAPTSVRKYLSERDAIMEQNGPVHEGLFIFPALLGFFPLGVAGLLALMRGTGTPVSSIPIAPIALTSIPFLAVLLIVGVVAFLRECRSERLLEDLDESAGVQSIPFSFPDRAYVLDFDREDILGRVADGVTPDVRDRLLGLIANGDREAAERAVAILTEEACRNYERERDRRAQKALRARESSARSALGRRG